MVAKCMKKLKGTVVSEGIVISKCTFINKYIKTIKPTIVTDVDGEINKFFLAKQKSIEQLETLYNNSIIKISKKDAMIFKSHQLMIQDTEFTDKIIYYIKVFKYNADYAIFKASKDYIDILKSIQSEYIAQRVDDIKDITDRLIENLLPNNCKDVIKIEDACILATSDLMPSEILTIDQTKVLGIITSFGNKTSHTSILAKNMNIPSVVGLNTPLDDLNNKIVILDSFSGEVIVDPDEQVIKQYKEKKKCLEKEREQLKLLINLPTFTVDKKEVKLMANITSAKDVENAFNNGAKGIGLFRSEFLYLHRKELPTEEELFNEYKSAIIKANGKEVIIRTIDIGSDKHVDYIPLPKETNPALGLRALRLCFDYIDVFKTQLRALIRASAYGNLFILIPMVISLTEVITVKNIINDIKKNLHDEGIIFKENIPLGVMVETPSAVMISDILAKNVDFFSIGTNDLVQYTLACDRDNASLTYIYNPNHISILRMIKTVVDNAHKNNIWVEICGEVASDQSMVGNLVGLGIDRFSVDIHNLLNVKRRLLQTDYKQSEKRLLNILYP